LVEKLVEMMVDLMVGKKD
jgi:hypothetical protein